MEKIIFALKKTLLPLFFCLFLVSCSNNKAVSLLKEDVIFSLNYGNFEDELNIFNYNLAQNIDTFMVMKNGFFYIANGESKKIMEMNSYGDLLSLYYNEDVNPKPSFSNSADVVSSTRKAEAYPFNKISAIAADSSKKLYVVDELPVDRQELDLQDNTVLSQVVLRFDSEGKFLDYLGQQGSGGTPFPLIKNIYVTDSNELVVVCLSGVQKIVYWFNQEGFLLYKVPISAQNVPNPNKTSTAESFVNVENVIPSCKERVLYVKADYSSSRIEEKTNIQYGIFYDETFVFALNVEDGTYEEPVLIPSYHENTVKGFGSEIHEIPYDFIGVSNSGWLFFMIATESGYEVQMVQGTGQRVLNRKLLLDRQKILYTTFNLNNTGILSALNIYNDSARVSWWRTDSLIQAVIKN